MRRIAIKAIARILISKHCDATPSKSFSNATIGFSNLFLVCIFMKNIGRIIGGKTKTCDIIQNQIEFSTDTSEYNYNQISITINNQSAANS